MSGGLNEDSREEWQIVKPDDENVVLGWRVTFVEETDALYLEGHEEDGQCLDSHVLEPYLLDAYVLGFKQAVYHVERGEDISWEELNDQEWERVLNPLDKGAEQHYMKFVEAGLYELGTRDTDRLPDEDQVFSRVQIREPWLVDFVKTFEDVEQYYREWVLGEPETPM